MTAAAEGGGGAGGLWQKIVLAGVSLAFAFALAETVLRIWPPRFYSQPLRQYHPDLGWIATPGKVFYRESDGRTVRFETNRAGFRDREHSFDDPPGHIRRIVLIGDSFAESAQVELHETFWSKSKDLLNLGKKTYWEIVNLGMSDYGTLQQHLALEEFGMVHRPDLVILQVFPLNDIVNNSIAAANVTSPHDAYRPYLDPATDYRTITYLNPGTSLLRRRSAVLRHAFLAVQQVVGAWGREMQSRQRRRAYVQRLKAELGWPTDPGRRRQTILFNTFAAEDDQVELTRQGWAATEAAIDRIRETVAAGDSRLMVMVVPHATQLRPHLWEDLPFAADPRYAEVRLRRYLGHTAALVELHELFETNRRAVLPYLEGHLNADAHQLVANVLAAEVARQFPDLLDEPTLSILRETAEQCRKGRFRPRSRDRELKQWQRRRARRGATAN